MSVQAVAIIIGCLTFIGLISVLVGMFGERLRMAERLGQEDYPEESLDLQGWIRRFAGAFRPLGEFVPRSTQEMSRQERKLARAGLRSKDAVLVFYGVQVSVCLALLVSFVVTGMLARNPALYVLLSVLGGAALPDIWLARRTARRQLDIQNSLPDAMDLAVISIEAGLGLDQILLRVGQEFATAHPVLSEEFRLHNIEMNLGRSRVQAFRNLAERTGVDDLRSLVAILIQTDRFGTSIADSLRTFSETLRTKRHQRAEERAAKLPVKMIVPMVLFIFPSVGVVILGPAVLSILTSLLPALTGG